MKGLLAKDLRIILNAKYVAIVFLIIAIINFISSKNMNVIVWTGMLMGLTLSITTAGHDEHQKGKRYIFSLPVSRTTYVIEKYLLMLGLMIPIYFVGNIINMIADKVMGKEASVLAIWIQSGFYIAAGIGFGSILMMFTIICETKKSKLMMWLGFFGAMTILSVIASFENKYSSAVGAKVISIMEYYTLYPVQFVGVLNLISICILLITAGVSIFAINRKEF